MEYVPSAPKTWDAEADVVVVEFGAAGVATAVTAHELGAKVLIPEKAPEGQEGGNTRVAGQGYLNTSSVEDAVAYLTALCGPYTVAEAMVRVWAEEMCKNNAWLASSAAILRSISINRSASSSPIHRALAASINSTMDRPTAIPIPGNCSSGW
jgi:succinate dehydrogenase/fumarate reductase flavoprotein subunit